MKILLSLNFEDDILQENILKICTSYNCDYVILNKRKVNHPNYVIEALMTSESVAIKQGDLGIIIGENVSSMLIAANKVKTIRAIIAMNEKMIIDDKKLLNPNILVIPYNYIDEDTIIKCIESFLKTKYVEQKYNHEVETLNDYELSCEEC